MWLDQDQWIELLKRRYQTTKFQKKIEYSVQCIHKMASICDPFVYYSFGKDSSAMSHLIRQYYPNMKHIFTYHDETDYILDHTSIDTSAINLQKVRATPTSVDDNGNIIEVHERTRTQELIDAVAPYTWYFKGIRAQEASYRRIAVCKVSKTLMIHEYKRTNGEKKWRPHEQNIQYSCFPIGWRSEEDVRTYLAYHEIETPYQYKYWDRTTAWFTWLWLDSTVYALQQEDPDKYNEMISLYPELA